MRAIIADDEYKVCRLIEQLGDWERLGIEIIGICNDGEEALNLIIEKRPDLVITDIRMPVYDGLELIQRTRDMGIDTEFIVISGYRQFEYAYGAIRYGVSDYLLKPIDRQQLNAALAKICEKYQSRRVQEESGERLEQMQTERAAWEERQFLSLLAGGQYSGDCISEYRSEFHVPLEEGLMYQAFILNTSRLELHQPSVGFGKKTVETAREQLFMVAYFAALETIQGILILIGYGAEQQPAITQAISHIFSRVRALRDFYGDFDLTVALGKRVEGPAGLGETVAEAMKNERAKLTAGWNRILDPFVSGSAYRGQNQAGKRLQKAESLKSFDTALDCFQKEEIEAWFERWLKEFQSDKTPDAEGLLDTRRHILKKLEFCCSGEEVDAIRMRTDRARNGRDFILQLRDAAVKGLEEYQEAKDREETKPVRIAREYILKNYSRQLTLEEVASQAGFSAVYFSTMFKKLTGQSFADYLTEVRLEEAKRMLKEDNKSILEISEAVGYSDNKYFRKLFKKATGMKPSDYRKLYN